MGPGRAGARHLRAGRAHCLWLEMLVNDICDAL